MIGRSDHVARSVGVSSVDQNEDCRLPYENLFSTPQSHQERNFQAPSLTAHIAFYIAALLCTLG